MQIYQGFTETLKILFIMVYREKPRYIKLYRHFTLFGRIVTKGI